MEVKFLRDYRGRETKENFVREGETYDIDPKEIRHLVNEEVIEKRDENGLPLFADIDETPKKGKGKGKNPEASTSSAAGEGLAETATAEQPELTAEEKLEE